MVGFSIQVNEKTNHKFPEYGIRKGIDYVFRTKPVAGMQPDIKRATGGLDWGGGLSYLPP